MTDRNHRLGDSPDQLTLDLTTTIPVGAYHGVQQADDNAEAGWREAALAEIENLARSGQEFTADDVRARVGEPDIANRWGGIFLAARRAGLIEVVAVQPSSTPSRHAGMLRVWKGVTP